MPEGNPGDFAESTLDGRSSAEESLEESLPKFCAEVKPLVLRAVGTDGSRRDLLSLVLEEVPAVRQPQTDERLGEVVDVERGGLSVELGAERGTEIIDRPYRCCWAS